MLALLLAEVLDYTDSFEEKIPQGKPTMVKFFAPWCGHCKALAPKYSELSDIVGPDFVIAEVDCTRNGALCSAQEVRGYPTVKFFNKGEFVEKYSGAREAGAMKDWLNNKLE